MACADVQTIQAGNGTKTQFSFDFPYLFKSEITVSFWNATTKEWDSIATTDATYPWQVTDANPTIVEFTSTAPPSPATPVDPGETAVDNVRIRRVTNIDDIRALFNPGSAIRSDDLNKNFEQLRYAIQEANCQDVPEEVYQYLLDNYWDRFDNTLYSADTWRSDDATIATTAALDQRFQDEVNDTLTKAELATASNVMPDNDDAVPTTGALNDYINEVITNDIGTDGTGVTVTDDGDGTITLGLGAGSIDFDRIKDSDIITYTEQDAGSPTPADTNIFTASAAARRFDTLVQTSTPGGSNWETGKTWFQNDSDKTLSIWNGTSWEGVASGGTFTRLDQVIYVDAVNGSDTSDGHRISTPKKTIKAAIADINADATYGDGAVVIVAPGVYQETAPIDIQKNNVSIVGTALRSTIVHPTPATETESLFRVNSGTYIANLTFTGVKASGTRGHASSIDPDATYGLPETQGWNVSFYPGATIVKSPYIQNCTNFSDSEIDNSDLRAFNPRGGAAGDTDSAMTGGGLLIDGSVVDSASPLRSMVCDSYTHVGLDGPGILVTNNGYVQATSSYAFFNHYHIKCLNGGQANLAASTTDFGRYSLVADGRSPSAIFTAITTASAADQDITFTIDAPVVGGSWHGSATRPQGNMLVVVNGITYPVLSATANGAGWDVTISRPSTANRSINLGLNGAVGAGAAVEFYLRSMIASSGHTMEYVGSGTNYSALPENGGIPVEANQRVELNNGKVWTAITDHNGKFTVGDFFEVDQQTGYVTVPTGSIGFPQLIENLDTNGFDIVMQAGDTVDGRDVSVDGTKLDGIETGATADQTGAEIKAAYEGEADTNAFTDAEKTKLAGIASGATAYGDSDVDTHLNTSTATTGEVLSWTGSDYDWVAAASGGGELQQDAYNNLYAGDNALSSWTGTSLSYNVAIGESAGLDLTSGQKNVIIGYLGGQDITTAKWNIAIGSETFTGTAGATGNYNICLGQYTGYKITSGNSNICIGQQAGDAITTGGQNITIGAFAGSAIDTESKNTAVGEQAFRFATSGYQNAIFGHGAGDYCNGFNNTILGYDAQHNTGMSGSNNTVIGALATASSTSVSNEITLGNASITKLRVPGVSFEVSGGQVSANAYTETVYNLTGTAIDPANGAIQTKTLSANTTFTESLSAGESVLLMIDDGTAYTVTWPTTTWVGGSAPTLATTGYTVVELWKVGSTLYGAHVGDVA